MVRVRRLAEVRQMASHAICGRAFELSSNVARVAVECGMHSGQGKARVLQVVEFDPEPVIETMALIATGREAR